MELTDGEARCFSGASGADGALASVGRIEPALMYVLYPQPVEITESMGANETVVVQRSVPGAVQRFYQASSRRACRDGIVTSFHNERCGSGVDSNYMAPLLPLRGVHDCFLELLVSTSCRQRRIFAHELQLLGEGSRCRGKRRLRNERGVRPLIS
jgi:hypothetical protein